MTSESSAKDGQSGHEGTKSGIRGRLELADFPSATGEPVPTREASGPGQRVIQTRAETETGWYDFSSTVAKINSPPTVTKIISPPRYKSILQRPNV